MSYFDPVWNVFSKHTDGSIPWIPKQIVTTIGEDFHRQVGDGKVRTTLYKFRWEGYDKKDDVTPGSPSHIYRDMLLLCLL
jgi:hypothetical protein